MLLYLVEPERSRMLGCKVYMRIGVVLLCLKRECFQSVVFKL